MHSEVRRLALEAQKPRAELQTVALLAAELAQALRNQPPPLVLPTWDFSGRTIQPVVELCMPTFAMRLACRDQTSRLIKQRPFFISAFATPTPHGVVASFEFKAAPNPGRLLNNADTREWLFHNVTSIQASLSDYFADNEAFIHAHWLDGVLRQQLPVLDRVASMSLDVAALASTLQLFQQSPVMQARYRDSASLVSLHPSSM